MSVRRFWSDVRTRLVRQWLSAALDEMFDYLDKRALVLPSGVREVLAQKYGVSVQLVSDLERALRAKVLETLRLWFKVRKERHD